MKALSSRPNVATTIDAGDTPADAKSLLVRGLGSVDIVNGVPDEYLAASTKALGADQVTEFERRGLIGAGMGAMTDDADATPATPDPDDHVARLQAQIDAAKARRAGYRAKAAETVARGGPVRATDEELGIIKTDDTVGRIAADASQEVRSRLSRLVSRFGRGGKK